MIIFDLINCVFNCWLRFKICYFNSAVHTKLLKIILKGCSNFRNKELLSKIYWYFIDHFSIFWEARCFWVDKNQLFFNRFWSFLLLFHEIHQFFFWLFGIFTRFIKLGLEFGLKAIFRRWSFISESKYFILNVFWWESFWLHLLFTHELYQSMVWLFEHLIRWRKFRTFLIPFVVFP